MFINKNYIPYIKHILLFVSFLLLSCNINLQAQIEKVKVAVLDFRTVGDSADLGEGAAEILRTTLMETGRYTVIERGMLNQVLEEQKLSLTGIIDPKTAAGIEKYWARN